MGPTNHMNSNYGRNRRRVRSTSRLQSNIGNLEKGRNDKIIQLIGIEGSTSSTLILPERTEWSSLTGQVRQFISNRLHQLAGGNKEQNPVDLSRGNPKLRREKHALLVGSTFKR